MNSIELYVLVEDYKIDDIRNFREKFLCNYIEISEYYEFPPYVPRTEFETENFEEMFNFILSEKGRNYRFYFKSQIESEIQLGMIFFNKDNTLIVGLVVSETKVDKYLKEIKEMINASYCLTTFETAPPETAEEFKRIGNVICEC